jgi:hypothetical protein
LLINDAYLESNACRIPEQLLTDSDVTALLEAVNKNAYDMVPNGPEDAKLLPGTSLLDGWFLSPGPRI